MDAGFTVEDLGFRPCADAHVHVRAVEASPACRGDVACLRATLFEEVSAC